jgi:hypothetical protein
VVYGLFVSTYGTYVLVDHFTVEGTKVFLLGDNA